MTREEYDTRREGLELSIDFLSKIGFKRESNMVSNICQLLRETEADRQFEDSTETMVAS